MTGVLDELGLTRLVTSITGASPVGAAAILAQTGDPRRFAAARALVKHAGLAPREKLSGAFVGRTKLTGQGRPGLRLAAWRAVWGAQRANPVYAARYRHLTSREHNKLRPTQAQTVIAAAILRHLHAVITTGQTWDPTIAAHGSRTVVTSIRRQALSPASAPASGESASGQVIASVSWSEEVPPGSFAADDDHRTRRSYVRCVAACIYPTRSERHDS
jgi:hypothetical protein